MARIRTLTIGLSTVVLGFLIFGAAALSGPTEEMTRGDEAELRRLLEIL